MAALTVWTHGDGLLSILAPIGLAAAAGTALVIDLDPGGPAFGGAATLAGLVDAAPRREDLRPSAAGTALLANGGVGPQEAEPVVRALMAGWPSVVLRSADDEGRFAPVAPVYPLLPGLLAPRLDRFCVYQLTGFPAPQRAEGIVLPRPASGTIRRLAAGSLPVRSRWIRAWRRVWEHAWR